MLLSGIDVTERKRQEEEIRASRTRIIEAADDARRVLERNLHDGAQQRLVALSVSLRLAEARTATDPAEAATIIGGAREELAAALEELRELARGIHPAVLTDRGLAAAVEALVVRTPLPVDRGDPARAAPRSDRGGGLLRRRGGAHEHRQVRRRDGDRGDGRERRERCHREVTDDGCGGADPTAGTGLRGLRDRVGGTRRDARGREPGRTGERRIIAEIPLEARGRASRGDCIVDSSR